MGASHSWTVPLGRQEHRITVSHATHSGRVRLKIDGSTAIERKDQQALWDKGFDHEFLLDGVQCRLQITFLRGKPTYELWINGDLHGA